MDVDVDVNKKILIFYSFKLWMGSGLGLHQTETGRHAGTVITDQNGRDGYGWEHRLQLTQAGTFWEASTASTDQNGKDGYG